jgi:hypothetical protein
LKFHGACEHRPQMTKMEGTLHSTMVEARDVLLEYSRSMNGEEKPRESASLRAQTIELYQQVCMTVFESIHRMILLDISCVVGI